MTKLQVALLEDNKEQLPSSEKSPEFEEYQKNNYF